MVCFGVKFLLQAFRAILVVGRCVLFGSDVTPNFKMGSNVQMGSTFRSGSGVTPGIHFWIDLLLGGSTSWGI